MNKLIKDFCKRTYIYFIVFIIPFIVLVFSYLINGIFPGSEKNLFISDLGGQYIGFFSYIRSVGIGYNNIMFQTLGGLGGGFFGTFAYYISDPLDLIVLLFDQLRLSDAIYYLTLIKISLCGVTFALFVKLGHIKCNDPLVVIISSVSYALMSYNIIYSLNVMWISGVIMLPLVILGIDNIFAGNGRELFIISLCMSVLMNYYTAYMIIVFCVFYFLYRSAIEFRGVKHCFRLALKLLTSGAVSALISACIWLPVLVDLSKGKLSEQNYINPGLIRNPLVVLRQLMPAPYVGISSNDVPPLYCGLLITFFLAFFMINKKISIRKKLAVLTVLAVFLISVSFGFADAVWHCFRVNNGFPCRYSFIISFFLIFVFADNYECVLMINEIRPRRMIRTLLTILVSADLIFNSAYGIYSLDINRMTQGYSNNSDYIEFYKMSETFKALGFTYPDKVASRYKYSHVDGFLYSFPSLDYYSSSYNYNVSRFLRDLGMNSQLHYTEDIGICPVTATVLNVEGVVSGNDDNGFSLLNEMYDQVYSGNGYTLFRNPYQGSLGYSYREDTYSASVSGDVFSNINHLYQDLAGDDVFVRCRREDKETAPIDADTEFARKITIYPEPEMHLYMYVSSEDYYEDGRKECDDRLYYNDSILACYIDMPDRCIVDLGYSDGSALTFTYESDSKNNEIYFYSFDKERFIDSVGSLQKNCLYDVMYSKDGIDACVTLDEKCNVAIFLPYEEGYMITVDGYPSDYGSYAGCMLSIPVDEGTHHIHITYFTPGLKAGLMLSVLGVILFVIIILSSKKITKSK